MARSIQEIQNEIIAAKNADIELSALNSTSSTAIWRLWTYITAFVINIFEQYQDTFKIEISEIIAARRIGSLEWYVSTSFDFQLGDNLINLPNGNYGYALIDESKRIVSRASAKVESGEIKLKLAKGISPNLVQLTNSELIQFTSYMELVKFAGTAIEYISLAADVLDITCDVYYDGLASTTTVETNIEAKINDFLSNLSFDGVLKKNALIEAIRETENVTDIVFTVITGTQGAVVTNIGREYETVAGYINLNTFVVDNFIVDAF